VPGRDCRCAQRRGAWCAGGRGGLPGGSLTGEQEWKGGPRVGGSGLILSWGGAIESQEGEIWEEIQERNREQKCWMST